MLQVAPDLYQVRIPVPFPLKFVNCYLARGPHGWDMLDTGMNYEPALAAWEEAFRELAISPEAIRAIYITHIHADHYGLARWFQQRTGATVYMLDREFEQVPLWEDPQRLPALLSDLFRRHGMPSELLDPVVSSMAEIQRKMGGRSDRLELLHDDDEVLFGRRRCRVIWTPGHSDGMFCLYAEEDGLFFAADHVLPRITPNVSIWPESRPDPLADYMASLDRVRELPASQTLPCHGTLIADLEGRVTELREHHQERLEVMLAATAGGRTAYQVATSVFREGLTPHEVRFALAETLAHLEYLANQRVLGREEDQGRILYVPR